MSIETRTESEAPTAMFTNHCPKCGSAEMWSQGSSFGCDSCGAQFTTEDERPVQTLARRDT